MTMRWSYYSASVTGLGQAVTPRVRMQTLNFCSKERHVRSVLDRVGLEVWPCSGLRGWDGSKGASCCFHPAELGHPLDSVYPRLSSSPSTVA